jgi:hypothetical protein
MPSTPSDTRQPSHPDLSVPIVVGLLVSLFGSPLLGRLDLPRWVDATATRSFLTNSLSTWLLVGLVLAIVLYWENQPD